MEIALDNLPPDRDINHRRQDILPALLILMLGVHTVAIYLLPVDLAPSVEERRKLSIRLLPLTPVLRHVPALEPSLPAEVEETVAQPDTLPFSSGAVLPESLLPEPFEVDEVPAETDTLPGIAERAREQARELATQPVESPPVYRQFSISDLVGSRQSRATNPAAGGVEFFSRSTGPTHRTAPNGTSTEKIGDRCFQQRGDLNNPASWRWHRVPAELCGQSR